MKKFIILTVFIASVVTVAFPQSNVVATDLFAPTAQLNGENIIFPNDNGDTCNRFKKYLISNQLIDINGDKEVSVQEAYNFGGKIDLTQQPGDAVEIQLIGGIEYFSNLKVLNMGPNNIDVKSAVGILALQNLDTIIVGSTITEVFTGNAKYIDITNSSSTDTITIYTTDLSKIDTVITKLGQNYRIRTNRYVFTDNSIGGIGGWLHYTYSPLTINKPFTCNSTIGLTSIMMPYDSARWNTGETDPLLFNQCSGVHTLKVYFPLNRGAIIGSEYASTTNPVYSLYNFTIADTTFIINNPNTFSVTPVITNTISITQCTPIPDSTPRIVGYLYKTGPVNDSTPIFLLWSYSKTMLLDTFYTQTTSKVGLDMYVLDMYCPDGSFRSATQTGRTIVTDYVMIDNTTPGMIHWKYGSLVTAIEEEHTYNPEVIVAPNPFSTTTKISGLTNGALKIINISGAEVYSQVIQESTIEINREGLSSGIYFLQIVTNNATVVNKKIIIE